jgi:hypothetical protein
MPSHGVFAPPLTTNKTEIVMSTLSIPLGNIAPSAAAPPASPGLFARLIEGREMRARREIVSYLMSQSDDRLAGFGFSTDDIHDLREGNLRSPVAR